MADILIGIHAGLGELGALAFLWVLVELLSPTPERVSRARKEAMLGVIFFFLSWIIGGFYYTSIYGAEVKPVIKAGPMPWAHSVITETKEHVFMFLPFLSLAALGLLRAHEGDIMRNAKARAAVLMLCAVIVLLALSMAGMGYIISTGARNALEVAAA